MNNICGRCIWITGASSGLGKALASQLAEEGNFVIISARSQAALNELVAKYPGNIKSLPLNINDQMDLTAASNQLRELTDYLDMAICAAGICEYEDNLSFNIDMYKRVMDTNFFGVVRTLNVALPLLKKSQLRPQFAAISSLSTCLGLPRAEAYGASKAALNYFMQSLRVDLVKTPLDFSLVRPGFIATDLTRNNDFAMPFLMQPEAAAQHIIQQLAKRKFHIDFPHRLSWLLRLGAIFFNSWCRWIAPRMTRINHW